MQYILMLHAAESGWAQLTEAQQREGMAAYLAYTEALKKAGVLRGVNRLRPSTTATLVRAAEGKSQVLNGPYVDTKEQMGGYYVIDVPDQEAAVAWAKRCPTANHGTVEVRPLWEDAAA
jgi:hypothetical protein